MHRRYNLDKELLMHDGLAAISSDGAGVVASAAATKDVGGANSARFEAVCVIDISDTDDTDGTETYTLQVRGSAASNMGSPAVLAEIPVTRGTTGKIELPFCNVKQGTAYRYVDVYFDVGGDTPSITCTAYLAPVNWC